MSVKLNDNSLNCVDYNKNIQNLQTNLVECNRSAIHITNAVVKEKLYSDAWLSETQTKISALEEFANEWGRKTTPPEEEKKEIETSMPDESNQSSLTDKVCEKVAKSVIDDVLENYTGLNAKDWYNIEQRLELIAEENFGSKEEQSFSLQGIKKKIENKLIERRSDRSLDKGLAHFTGMKKNDFEKVAEGMDTILQPEEEFSISNAFNYFKQQYSFGQARSALDKGIKHLFGHSTAEAEKMINNLESAEKKAEKIAEEDILRRVIPQNEKKEQKLSETK